MARQLAMAARRISHDRHIPDADAATLQKQVGRGELNSGSPFPSPGYATGRVHKGVGHRFPHASSCGCRVPFGSGPYGEAS